MSRARLSAQVFGVLLGLAGPSAMFGPAPAHAVGGCTVTYPATNCMYSCTVGETQHVEVTGMDVTGRADCGFGVAQCYTGLGDLACTSSGSAATFSDTYWKACSVSHGSLALYWVVACQSG